MEKTTGEVTGVAMGCSPYRVVANVQMAMVRMIARGGLTLDDMDSVAKAIRQAERVAAQMAQEDAHLGKMEQANAASGFWLQGARTHGQKGND